MVGEMRRNLRLYRRLLGAQLRSTLGPRHPDVLQLESQIENTRSALQRELGTYADSAANDRSCPDP